MTTPRYVLSVDRDISTDAAARMNDSLQDWLTGKHRLLVLAAGTVLYDLETGRSYGTQTPIQPVEQVAGTFVSHTAVTLLSALAGAMVVLGLMLVFGVGR